MSYIKIFSELLLHFKKLLILLYKDQSCLMIIVYKSENLQFLSLFFFDQFCNICGLKQLSVS